MVRAKYLKLLNTDLSKVADENDNIEAQYLIFLREGKLKYFLT